MRWRARLLAGVLGLAACAGAPASRVRVRVPPVTAPVDAVFVAAQEPRPSEDLGPEILLPMQPAVDEEVARVGDLVLRKSDAYSRLLTADPKLALSAIDLLVFDVLVARHAQQFGIRVSSERVEELAGAEEQQLRKQVQTELGNEMTFSDYLWRIFGMREADWRRALRLRTAQRLYQGYVIRYLGLREDRVQVRYLVNKDPKVVQEAVDKAKAGADFGTLALRWSEDSYRRDGGLLPMFGRGFPHPVAETAFRLKRGEVSAPFEQKVGDQTRWFAVFCLDRLDGREVPFLEVREELDRDLQNRPLAPIETSAYTLRWRGKLERPPEPKVEESKEPAKER
ncbi:MAG: peptidylprolyl isomerase [Planctomycetes bacterium]|nr:peptidylprolyl isomerase [Planctomycetota bacterium]